MDRYFQKRLILFSFIASVLCWPTVYMALAYATNAFFKAYPASPSAQSEAIGIILNEIAPYGCLAANIVILGLSLVYRIKVTDRLIERAVIKYLLYRNEPEATLLVGNIQSEIREN